MAASVPGIRNRLGRSDLPPSFWYLWLGTIVNRLGGFATPFLVLYLTSQIGMTVAAAALLVSVLGAGSFIAQLTGGELADRLGRRPVMMLSFFVTPVAMIVLGLTHETVLLAVAMFAVGFFTDLSRPAINAAVVDLVPAATPAARVRVHLLGDQPGRRSGAGHRRPARQLRLLPAVPG